MIERTQCPGSGEAVRRGGFPVIIDAVGVTMRVGWCPRCQYCVLVVDGEFVAHPPIAAFEDGLAVAEEHLRALGEDE
jgi:hypothetical protein